MSRLRINTPDEAERLVFAIAEAKEYLLRKKI